MPFHYILTNLLVDVPEALGAVLADSEGEAVEWVSNRDGPPFELRVEGAVQAVTLRHLGRVTAANGGGSLESYALVGGRLATLTQLLPHGYYVVLVARRSGSLGLARFHLRRAAAAIAGEL
jgi:predicted regulator of Ras-like GTPase activity (Roadblock/LC7/MglB family)